MKILFSSIILISIVLNQTQACDAPAKFKASINNETGNIVLSWERVQNATEYFLYVPAVTELTNGTTFYEVANSDLGVKYNFQIKANSNGSGDSATSKIEFGPAIFSSIGTSVNFDWKMYDIRPANTVDVMKGDILLFTVPGSNIWTYNNAVFKERITYWTDSATGWMHFSLRNIVKEDAGYYNSFQSMTQNGGQVLVVIDRPTKPVIRTSGQPIVGQPFELSCDSRSTSKPDYYKPKLEYYWYINSWDLEYDFHENNRNITIPQIRKREDKGTKFTCWSADYNLVESLDSDVVTIDPLYPAEIKEVTFSVNSMQPVIYDGDLEVSESDKVIIQCNVDGDPVPEIAWDFNGTPLGKSVERSLRQELRSVQCTDTGGYTCTTNNEIKTVATQSIQMKVKCSPRIDKRVTTKVKYGLKLGESTNINISVIAYPKPTGTWKTNTSGVITEIRTVDINLYSFTYSATVQVKRPADFGKYWIELNNRIGNFEKIYIEIKGQDRPQVPSSFAVQEVFPQMVNLSWISEFDGGLRQTFIIEYSEKEDNSTIIQTYVKDKIYGKKIEAPIRNLKANTSYSFKLYSRNTIGRCDKARELEIRTKAYVSLVEPTQQSNPHDPSNTITIGLSSVFAVIFVATIVIFVVILKIQRKKAKRSNAKDERHTFREESASSERQQANDIDLHIIDTDTQDYQNACRTRELAAEMPYQDLKPDDAHEDRETPYTEIKNRNSPIVTEHIELNNRNIAAAKETYYDDLENDCTDAATDEGQYEYVSDKMYVNTTIN